MEIELQIVSVEKTHTVIVDYNKSLKEMIALGDFDGVDPEIIEVEPFIIQGTDQRTMELYLAIFNRHPVSDNEATDKLRNDGFEPAGIEFIIALGAVWMMPSREIMIWSLQEGSGHYNPVWPGLAVNENGKCIVLDSWSPWDDHCPGRLGYYLVFKKQ